jgi:hypothetical protein
LQEIARSRKEETKNERTGERTKERKNGIETTTGGKLKIR